MQNGKQGRVLIVAGSDSGGGAGIQADIKAVTIMGGFATTAITAITVQNTLGVHGIHEVPVDIFAAQMRAVLEDIGTDAVKTGMLHSAAIVEAVAEAPAPVVEPVVVEPAVEVAAPVAEVCQGPVEDGAGAIQPDRIAGDAKDRHERRRHVPVVFQDRWARARAAVT